MHVEELERIMDDYDFQGFPVVQSLSDPVIQGFITRGDLEYALLRIHKTQGIDPLALVFFTEVHAPGDSDLVLEEDATLVKTLRRSSSGVNGAPLRCLDLSHYMDRTPLSVPPRLPAELVIDLFVKMGPRYLIVKENGRLSGIITKKDVLHTVSHCQ